LNAAHFHDEAAARAVIEGVRWPNGPVCPHCGEVERRYATRRPGRHRCGRPGCRRDYSVTTRTVMESSHIPLHKWLLGFHLLTSSKKGISSHQLHRMLGLTYKSAWFLAHRIREAMRAGGLTAPMGQGGGIVEADETYFGKAEEPRPRNKYLPPPTKRGKTGPAGKRAVVALVERGGKARSFHVATADKENVDRIVRENVSREARLHTDESRLYGDARNHVAKHERVKHSAGEYVRGDVHTNCVEGLFSVFKRGMKGNYQHCKEKHLHRYLAEFDFRYNHRIALGINDAARATAVIKAAEGKRLTYRQPH
jgi:transposase-like protein